MDDVTKPDRWRYATPAAVAVWIVLMVRLMIADVWDETNGMLYFSDPANSLGEIVRFVLTQSLGFWRPLPTLLAGAVMHFLPDFAVSWRVLRAINMALLVGAIAILAAAAPPASTRIAYRDASASTSIKTRCLAKKE